MTSAYEFEHLSHSRQKYIEENLAKRKGIESEEQQEEQSRYQTLDEVALRAVPSMLRESTSKRNEEMLSNQVG